jgi:hypothetical protein
MIRVSFLDLRRLQSHYFRVARQNEAARAADAAAYMDQASELPS